MSFMAGVPVGSWSTNGMTEITARLSALDARLRAVDPDWRGISPTSLWSGTAASPNPVVPGASTFADVLGSETTRVAGAASSLAATRTAWSGVAAGNELVEPVVGASVSQAFGPSTLALEPPADVDGVHYAHFHAGIDLAAPLGTTVRAAAAGVVTVAGRQADGAVVVMIRDTDGSETLYGHLQTDTAVHTGDRVSAGQAIGAIGLTGVTTGPHLHFALLVDGKPVDPAAALAGGRLPGVDTPAPTDAATQAGAASAGAGSVAGLAAFDAVADEIPYAPEIRAAAVAAGVEPLLLASLVRAESGFRADAVSSAGALGLAQLMPANVKSLGVTDAFDPAQNVTAAARYFANNLRLYGRTDLALAAYQAGKGAVAQAGGIPNYPTTHHYIDRILGFWSGYLERAQAGASEEAA
jgi:hypothetical protein